MWSAYSCGDGEKQQQVREQYGGHYLEISHLANCLMPFFRPGYRSNYGDRRGGPPDRRYRRSPPRRRRSRCVKCGCALFRILAIVYLLLACVLGLGGEGYHGMVLSI